MNSGANCCAKDYGVQPKTTCHDRKETKTMVKDIKRHKQLF